MSAPATEPNPTLDRRNRVLRTATPCSAGSLEIREGGNGLLRAAADARVAPVGLEPAGSVKISYMPTHARARRAAAGQPPEAIVPRLHACMHARQSMQHAREAEGSWHAAAQVRARWPCLAPRRTHSMIPWPGGRAGHDSPPFFPRPEPAAPVPQPSGLPEKEVGGNECATGPGSGRGRDASLPTAMAREPL
jgi:hypothetical protein